MALVLTNGKISVGAYRISNRKHIALCTIRIPSSCRA